jgi:outer membrane lipoprotein SlyB
MRKILIGVAAAAALSLASAANAEPSNRTLSGAAIGAGTGALVAGPIGAVAGGVVGAVVGGPTFRRSGRYCWYDRRGYRHCRWR